MASINHDSLTLLRDENTKYENQAGYDEFVLFEPLKVTAEEEILRQRKPATPEASEIEIENEDVAELPAPLRELPMGKRDCKKKRRESMAMLSRQLNGVSSGLAEPQRGRAEKGAGALGVFSINEESEAADEEEDLLFLP